MRSSNAGSDSLETICLAGASPAGYPESIALQFYRFDPREQPHGFANNDRPAISLTLRLLELTAFKTMHTILEQKTCRIAISASKLHIDIVLLI